MNSFGFYKKINPYGEEDDVLQIVIESEADIYRMHNVVTVPETYTFVIWHCCDVPCDITFNILGTQETISSATEWTKYVKTVDFDGVNQNIDIIPPLSTKTYFYEGYIAKGVKDTSWSLAPEDILSGIEGANATAESSMTMAEQTADKFTWLVKSGTDETNFELTDRTASLVAENINLKGLVSFSGFNTETKDKINAIENNATNASNTLTDWSSDAVKGETLINGGYIQTHTIKTEHLDVDDILAEDGTFLGVIEARDINADRIKTGHITADLIDAYGLNVLQRDTDIVTFNIDNDGDVTMRGNVESYDYVDGKTGWSIRSSGDAEFNAITVRGDLIGNYGGIMSLGGTGRNLLKDSGTSITNSDYNIKNYALAITPVDGQTYTISIKGTLGEGKTNWGIYNSGGSVVLKTINSNEVNSNGVFIGSFTWTNTSGETTVEPTEIWVFAMSGDVTVESTIEWIKLEEGKTATPWSAAPEDELKEVVFWAGSSYDQRDYAPFRVYSDGSVSAQRGDYSGVWTGTINVGNITISDPNSSAGSDALLTIRDGANNIRRVQLTDTDTSTLAQNLFITDNYDNGVIEIRQDGLIQTNGSFRASSDNSFITVESDTITINGNQITDIDGDIALVSETVYVGNSSTNSNLEVFGDITTNNKVNVGKEINFGGVISCKVTQKGIDFSFNDVVVVTFNTNGGTQVNSQFIRIGGYVTKPFNPTRSGYVFVGWYKDEAFGTAWNFDTDVVTGNTTIYAKWLALPMKPTVTVQNYTIQTYHEGDIDYEQGCEAKTPLVVNASVTDGGSLSYKWDVYAQFYDADWNVNQSRVFADKRTNTITVAELNEHIRTMSASSKDYVTIHGTCIVTNTLNRYTSSVTVEVGYRL